MCLLYTCYRFARAHPTACVSLWPSARAELAAFHGLLPLLRSQWWLLWFPRPVATDASEFAYGVCFGSWPEGSTARTGRTNECAWFKRLPGRSARDHFFAQSGIEGDGDGGWKLRSAHTVEWAETEDFPEVPLDLLAGELWTPVISRPWKEEASEDIYIFEMRALLRGIEALISEFSLEDCRIVCLVDNMSVALSVSRRRSKDFVALTLIRRIVALALVFNIKVVVRWIPSEANCSDAPSRLADADDVETSSSLYSVISSLLGRDGAQEDSHAGSTAALGRPDLGVLEEEMSDPECFDEKYSDPFASAFIDAPPLLGQTRSSTETVRDEGTESSGDEEQPPRRRTTRQDRKWRATERPRRRSCRRHSRWLSM